MGAAERKLKRDQQVEMQFLEGVVSRCPDDVQALTHLAALLTLAGRYEDGLRADQALSRLCPTNPVVWYNLACSHALLGQAEAAFSALERAVELGFEDSAWMARDEDLASIRQDIRFADLARRMRHKAQTG